MAGAGDAPAIGETPYRRMMRRVAAIILALGLAAAAGVYLTAADEEVNGDRLLVTNAANSRRYQLELRRIGGQAAVAAAQFDEWFDSLWHGRRLAGTLAVISIAGALLCLLAAHLPPPKPLKPLK